MARIWQFVITGGPCAGKTTGLATLEQMLTKRGFKVIVVAETATELISSGIVPWEFQAKDFQGILIDRSLNKALTAIQAATCYEQDVVILYDRGLLDNKAYMTNELFMELLRERSLTETWTRDQYDAIFHLVTAAEGAEKFYTLENNAARTETPEQARELDKNTQNAWVGHPHLCIIDNTTSFKEKIDRLITEVLSVIGLPIPLQIQRRYRIEMPTEEMLTAAGCVKLNMFYTYLKSDDPKIEKRIRQRGDGQSFSYFYTEKSGSGITRIKTERRINEKEYIAQLMNGVKSVRKSRYCFIYHNQYFDLDIYESGQGQAILEISLTNESQVPIIPDWVNVIEEVTENPKYLTANLAT
ncbi:MAG: AAA family ATPase [Bacteroidales bacterium]|jgi:predicted ATPase/CYTH domain-containing protein|nr:AAA family ATPase [Bacteroidales bacterium]